VKINKILNVDGMNVKFESELSEEEVTFLLEVALNTLSNMGAMALQESDEEDEPDLMVLGDTGGNSIN